MECELAGADRKARTNACDLRDRTGGRSREADVAAIARPSDKRRHFVWRTRGLAGDPLQPQEPAGNRRTAGHQDAATAAHAGRVKGIGDCDAVESKSLRLVGPRRAKLAHRWPAEGR